MVASLAIPGLSQTVGGAPSQQANSLFPAGIKLPGLLVEKNPKNNNNRSKTGERCHGVAKQDDREPD